MRLISSSTFANQSIAASTLVGAYTADAPREIFVRLFADQVNGGANYIAFLAIQRAGAGAVYQCVPKTSASVDTTASAMCMTTIAVPLSNTDVLKVYLTGASDDSTTPDVITEVWETMGASAISPSNFGASAVDSNAFAQVAADKVWSASTRSLTQSAAQAAATLTGSALTLKRGDTWVQSITGLGDISNNTKVWLTVKRSCNDADSAALLQLEKTGGLLWLNGAATTASYGTLTVDNAVSGNITFKVGELATKDLVPEYGLVYDIQYQKSGSILTPSSGEFNISDDVTRAAS